MMDRTMTPWFETHRFAMLLTMRPLEFGVTNSDLILSRREAPSRRMAAW